MVRKKSVLRMNVSPKSPSATNGASLQFHVFSKMRV
jgi:hypothetical protein